MEYCQSIYKTSSKSILWECFGHVLVDNISNNIDSGIEPKARSRMAYNKAKIKYEESRQDNSKQDNSKQDNVLTDTFPIRKWQSVDITKNDMDFIEETIDINTAQSKKDRKKPYKNDPALIYVLLCLFKNCQSNKKLTDDGFMRIKNRSHDSKFYNFNNIIKLAGVNSYPDTLERLRNNGNVIVKNSEDDVYTLINFNIPADDNSEILFVVEDIENPIIYKESWESRKPLSVCCNMFCKKHYFKERNKDTCSDKCSKKLKEKQDQDVAWEKHIITVKNKIVV